MDRCPRQPNCLPPPHPALALLRELSAFGAQASARAALALRWPAWVFAAALALIAPEQAWSVAPSPIGGCPAPLNSLVITEISLGDALAPRWIELHNPGKLTISLAKVQLEVHETAATKNAQGSTYAMGDLLPQLLAGETVAIGWVPAGPATALLKLKVLDLGESFVLPCAAKLILEGPAGPIDQVSYDVCAKGGGVWGLDPAQTDICKNDTLTNWCPASGDLLGLGSPGKVNAPCDLDSDGYPSVALTGGQADCDDLNKSVFPGATEACNGKDDDCNGQTDENLQAPPGTCLTKGVCAGPLGDGKPVAKCDGVGGFSCTYPYGYEAVSETLCDGFDNDCDGFTDEGLSNACGGCGAVPAEACNGVDDDCNGATDDLVALANDCTATGVCGESTTICKGGKPTCAFPLSWEATETRCDGLDNDCDGQTDEEMGIGSQCSKGAGICTGSGQWQCGAGGELVCSAVLRPASPSELCGDGLDNNCDGQTDETFDIGAQCQAGKGVCKVVGKRICSSDKLAATCSVQPLAAASAEICANELDDDCDGQTDEKSCEEADNPGIIDCSARRPSGQPLALGLLLLASWWAIRRRACS